MRTENGFFQRLLQQLSEAYIELPEVVIRSNKYVPNDTPNICGLALR